MTGKERMLRALNGSTGGAVAATPHWWGVYKFQFAGVARGPEDEEKGWALQGARLAQVDSCFYETFRPDMLHLTRGAWSAQPGDGERRRAAQELKPAVKELSSKRLIDEYVTATTPSEAEIWNSGIYSHLPILVETYGEQALLVLNDGNPVCGVFENNGPAGDFQDALIATVEQPENLAYLIYKLYEANLVWMRVLKRAGAHGYIGSETCVSADILSPKTFRALILPALRLFYQEVERMGLIPITYFLGDINPLLEDISSMGVKGLMVEESKKGFDLDVTRIRKALDSQVALFGNVDSVYDLLMGRPEQVEAETRRQCSSAAYGPFILACGSPLCYDTPTENIHAMMRAARSFHV
jgi:hypothetical protein